MIFDRPRAAVVLSGFCAFLELYAPQVILPDLAKSFDVSAASAGTAVGISTLAVALAAPFVGLLADRCGRKRTIVAAALLSIVPTVMLVGAQNFDQILFWRFVQGLTVPAMYAPIIAYLNEEWSPRDATDIMGYQVAASAMGGFCGRFITASLAEPFGWRTGFAVLAVITLVCALTIWAWLPPERARIAGPADSSGVAPGLRKSLSNPALLSTCAVGFSLLFSLVAVFTYVNFHLAAPPFLLSAAQLGWIFLVYPFGAIAVPASGLLIRRLGRRQTMGLAVMVSAAGLLCTLQSGLPMVIAGLAVFVAGVFTMQAASMGYVGKVAGEAKATVVGVYVFCYYVGGSGGAVLPGLLVWDGAGWSGCVGLVLVTLCGTGSLAWWAWRREVRL